MKPQLDKAGYPSEWPILEAKDFCRKTISMGKQRCLLGWKNMALCDNPCIPGDATTQYYDVSNRIEELLGYQYGDVVVHRSNMVSLQRDTARNDDLGANSDIGE